MITAHNTLSKHSKMAVPETQENEKPSSATAPKMEDQFSAILSQASKQYSDGAEDSLEDFMKPPMSSVKDLEEQLDKQNEHFEHFRKKRHSIFKALSLTLKPVELVGDIASSAASSMFAPSQNIYSAVMYLVNAAHDVSATYDNIIELFEQLKDFTCRLEVYVKHELSEALSGKLVTVLATLFQVLVLSTKEVRRGRLRAYFKHLIGIDSPVQPALDKLKSLTVGEERLVIAEMYGGVSEINTKTGEVQDLVTEVNRNVQSLRLEQREQLNATQQDRLREILEPSPFPEDFYNGMTKATVEGTCEWVLEDEGLQAWLRGDTRYLWINGAPGTGKSYLASHIISHVSDKHADIGYFFFRDHYPETRSVLQALRDVAYQLSENDAFYAKQLMGDLHGTDETKTVSSAFRKLFLQPGEHDTRNRSKFIFLDGIDEADQKQLKALLAEFAAEVENTSSPEQKSKPIQVALIGRSYLSETVTFALDPAIKGDVFTSLQVSPDRNSQDVSAFISYGVAHSRILSRTTSEFREKVIKAMEAQVDGLFILAKFMLVEISRKRHPRSILKSLEEYPKEINGMISKTLEDLTAAISPEEVEDLNEMLRWVACAEDALTLEQLEAILGLHFGDPPIRLEESLRAQYSSLFELEREDGYSTDDLVKDFEREQRLLNGSDSSPRRLSPLGGRGGPRESSPARKLLASPPKSPPLRQLSPVRNGISSSDSPDLLDDPVNEMEFRSNKSTTYVSFFHTSVKDFFREGHSVRPSGAASETPKDVSEEESGKDVINNVQLVKESSAVGFDALSARLHILQTCLRIFTDKTWFEKRDIGNCKYSIKRYAAWYWQEHLCCINPDDVSGEEKIQIGRDIYRMLNDEAVIQDWTMMFLENGEGLEVFTDRNIEGLNSWMSREDVCQGLDETAKAWAAKASTSSTILAKPIGRFYAKAWLHDDFQDYVMTTFCFQIVQTVAYMEAGHTWSQSESQPSDYGFDDRIHRATEWANCPETAHWHRRVGSTYLVQNMHGMALTHYNKALEMDHNSVETSGRIAFCLYKYKRHQEALKESLDCAAQEQEGISNGTFKGDALSRSKWRLYKDYWLCAQCYYATGKIEEAFDYFRKAMEAAKSAKLDKSEAFEPEIGYLETLAAESRHEEIMELLEALSLQTDSSKYKQSRLIDLLLDQYQKPLVEDLIPRAACRVGKIDFLLEVLGQAITAADKMRKPLKVLSLRLAMGTTCAYNREYEDAIAIFEQISFEEYRPRGNVPTRAAHAFSFQRLASLYKKKVLSAGIESREARDWLKKLEDVHERQSKHQRLDMPANMLGLDVNSAAIYLALFYRLLGREEESQPLLKALIRESLEILSDDEPQNDEYALQNLVRILIAAHDIESARDLAQSMRKFNPKAALDLSIFSPVEGIDPKLPEILSTSRSCGQCLDVISLSEEFFMCEYCMESYCKKCLEGVIKQPGNATADHNAKMGCQSDHEWFAVVPLSTLLHRGDILIGNKEVRDFGAWKKKLQEKWEIGQDTA